MKTPINWREFDDAKKADFLHQLKLEAEARRTLWRCNRLGCDGRPHKGAPAKHARADQLAPVADWLEWVIKAGRGFGKTRSGAEFIRERVNNKLMRRGALVSRTASDYRDVMIEGESGLLGVFPRHQRPDWQPSKRRVVFHNGAVAHCYSSEEPDQLRGPQHDTVWGDEASTWYQLATVLYNIRFGLRLGVDPRACYTGTPRPTPAFKKLLTESGVVVTHGKTHDNLDNLAPTFKARIVDPYEGTRIGRQELYGEVLDNVEGALWTWDSFVRRHLDQLPPMLCVVVSVDPAVSSKPGHSDLSGIAVCGLGVDHLGYLLHSEGVLMSPDDFLNYVVKLYDLWNADYVIAETNNGGDYIEALLRTHRRHINYDSVNATRGKRLRAEPVSALYDQHRVVHVGPPEAHAPLEVLMTSWTGLSLVDREEESPDILDAAVHGFTKLLIDRLPNTVMIMEWLAEATKRNQSPSVDEGDYIFGVVEEEGRCLATCVRHKNRIVELGRGNLVTVKPNSRVVVWSRSGVSDLDWVMPTTVFNPMGKTGATDKSGTLSFDNAESAAWWNLRESLHPTDGIGLALLELGTVDSELMAPTWRMKDNKISVIAPDHVPQARALMVTLTVSRGGSNLDELAAKWQ